MILAAPLLAVFGNFAAPPPVAPIAMRPECSAVHVTVEWTRWGTLIVRRYVDCPADVAQQGKRQ